MSALAPFASLYEAAGGETIPLPASLAEVYGSLRLPTPPGRPFVFANFVNSLDGVVSLNLPGQAGGGEISGYNRHDAFLMGLLRAVADAVVVGAGTLRAVPQHLWTPDYIYPPLADEFRRLRRALGKPEAPLNVIVTASGVVDPRLPVFRTGAVPVLLVTTAAGAEQLRARDLPTVEVVSVTNAERVSARGLLAVLRARQANGAILVEGGPHLLGDFLAEKCLDELFLTLAPQVAGRQESDERPGMVAGREFAPGSPLWGDLLDVRRAGSHLFLRYGFASQSEE
jgi:riboflavin biosynthesis pyrimidine reductase